MGRTGFAHLKHYTAEFREWGEGPPLVLVPGMAGGINLLGPLARLLAEDFRVICFQLRGEDDCFVLRRQFGLDDLVEDLNDFLEWHFLERPAIMGVSFGGILALEFASRFPNSLSHLMVQGVGARFERGLLQQLAGTVLSRYPLPSDSPLVNQYFNLLFGGRTAMGPLFQFVTQQCWHTDQSVMAHRFRLVEQFDMGPRLSRIQAPTLVLAGDRDLLVSERSLHDLCEGIPDTRLVKLAGCGHLGFVTQPFRVAGEVKAFLNADAEVLL